MTALQYMSSLMPGVLEPKVRAHLARFGLSREKALTEIEKLSGGEKARLLFAVMTRDAPGLLILDEPTNHLDIDGREALTAALNAYAGSVILITHDLHLIELIADSLWLVKDAIAARTPGIWTIIANFCLKKTMCRRLRQLRARMAGSNGNRLWPAVPKSTVFAQRFPDWIKVSTNCICAKRS